MNIQKGLIVQRFDAGGGRAGRIFPPKVAERQEEVVPLFHFSAFLSVGITVGSLLLTIGITAD